MRADFTDAELVAARGQLDELGVNTRWPDERDAAIVLAYLRGGLMSLLEAHPEDAGLRGLAAVVNVWRYQTLPEAVDAIQVKCEAHEGVHPVRDDCVHPYMPPTPIVHPADQAGGQPDA